MNDIAGTYEATYSTFGEGDDWVSETVKIELLQGEENEAVFYADGLSSIRGVVLPLKFDGETYQLSALNGQYLGFIESQKWYLYTIVRSEAGYVHADTSLSYPAIAELDVDDEELMPFFPFKDKKGFSFTGETGTIKSFIKLVNNWDEYVSTITNGEAAGVVNGNWITATIASTEDQKGQWAITTMPSVDGVDSATHYANNGGSSWYVTANCQNKDLAEDFLKSTFGSSTDFYDAILPQTGAIACYLPAGESDVYNEPNEFFNDQPIYSTIVEYSSHIPEFTKTPYHYEARECINTAVVNIVNGTAKADALQEAQDTLQFKQTSLSYSRYSFKVVAPTQCSSPLASICFNSCPASMSAAAGRLHQNPHIPLRRQAPSPTGILHLPMLIRILMCFIYTDGNGELQTYYTKGMERFITKK